MRFHAFIIAGVLAVAAGSASRAADAPLWGYSDEDAWAGLSPAYAICETGTQQSPVVIAYTEPQKLPALALNYQPSQAQIRQKDHTLAIRFADENTLTENGHAYRLMQLRLHTPGEHQLAGRFQPLELQFLHKDAEGNLLILSVLAQIGTSNPALQTILEHAPAKPGETNEFMVDAARLLPQKRGYYAYTGSLTWPPCTQGVEWRVLKQPVDISQAQRQALAQFMDRNNRLPQPVYMRTIRESVD